MLELDPQMAEVLDARAAMGAKRIMDMDLGEARRLSVAAAALQGGPTPVAAVEDLQAGDVPIRLYRPTRAAGLPVTVYFHGGGWTRGNLDSHDPFCRALASVSGGAVVAVDYRLAPEHRFPAAVDDAYAAAKWVHENAERMGLDPTRLAVAGDSAGGNLAIVVTLLAREKGTPSIVFQALVYPSTDATADTESMQTMTDERLPLVSDEVRWYWDAYLGDADRSFPLVSPLKARDLKGLPPALLITAELDPIRDEVDAYGQRLEESGVPVTRTRYKGVTHGFFLHAGRVNKGRAAVMQVGNALKRAFETGKPQPAAGNLADAVFGSLPTSFRVDLE